MYYPFSWFKSLFGAACYFLLVTLCGAFFNQASLALALGALLLLANAYWKLHKLNLWLWHSKNMSPPKIGGIWEHIYDGIYALQNATVHDEKNLAR